jgi:hypothetical protein
LGASFYVSDDLTDKVCIIIEEKSSKGTIMKIEHVNFSLERLHSVDLPEAYPDRHD